MEKAVLADIKKAPTEPAPLGRLVSMWGTSVVPWAFSAQIPKNCLHSQNIFFHPILQEDETYCPGGVRNKERALPLQGSEDLVCR